MRYQVSELIKLEKYSTDCSEVRISFILIAIFILIKRVISHPHATPGMPGCHVTPAHIRSSQLTFSRYFYFGLSQIHTIKIFKKSKINQIECKALQILL